MELKECDRTDLEKIVALYHQTIRHLEETINYPRWSAGHPSDAYIEAAITAGEQYACMEQDRALGAVVLSTDPQGCYEAGKWSRSLKTGEFLTIHALAVNPLCRHQGVGCFLVRECMKIARQGGYQALRLDVVPGNIPARGLYEKMGFRFVGTEDLKRNIEEVPVFDLFEWNVS